MSGFPSKLRLKEKAEEDLFFAREDAARTDALRHQRHHATAVGPMVISGGQTGVDRAALDAAMSAGLAVGGWCPAGRRAEDGRIPDSYRLDETPSAEYAERTEWNVRDSDATLILYRGQITGGTRLTQGLARRHGRPLLLREISAPVDPQSVAHWLHANRIKVLNCAGPRESGAPGIESQARALLAEVFRLWRSEDSAGTPRPHGPG